MNEQAAGASPDPDAIDEGGHRWQRSLLERQLMDRARRAAERDRQPGPRRTAQHAIALVAALGLVLVVALGFDAFLTSMQKVMRIIDAEEQKQQQEQAAPRPDDPIPAYAVPSD